MVFGTSDHEGSAGLLAQIMTYKFGSRVEDVEERLNELLVLARRYDEATGADPVPDQVTTTRIVSNTLEPLNMVCHERWKAGKSRLSARGDRRLLVEPTHPEYDMNANTHDLAWE